ncbi:hypothetical protein [Acidisoma sp. L85]|uniref:hypothetical protein n=1 Tax=Acidisoma sp. L85 TaxID=1641850 RepID=UPI00131DC5C9|nr:hypothetical protein [Acidisoma sp. L85]
MPVTYNVGRIAREQIDPAYLLVHPLVPKLDLENWRALCEERLVSSFHGDDQDDIVVAVNPVGYVQGLCLCAVRRHLLHDRMLDVSFFVITSVADEAGVATDLLRHLKALAKREACDTIRVWTLWQDRCMPDLGDLEIDRRDHGLVIILNGHTSAKD